MILGRFDMDIYIYMYRYTYIMCLKTGYTGIPLCLAI